MADPRIPLKNRYFAAILAYLVPGAGHLYQGRVFKAVLYSVCILGTYLFGLYISDWKAVYWRWEPRHKNIAYFAQAGVGMFAIPAYVQAQRYKKQQAIDEEFEQPLSADFRGVLLTHDAKPQTIVGRINLEAEAGDFGREIRGRFVGNIAENEQSQPLELELAHLNGIGPKVGAGASRRLECDVVDTEERNDYPSGQIVGVIPRRLSDHFAAPLQDADLENLSGDLGKFYELAKIFTWIAGLLNVLAIWDALEGPAYGYGDESESESDGSGDGAEASAKLETIAAEDRTAAQPNGKPAAAEEPVA